MTYLASFLLLFASVGITIGQTRLDLTMVVDSAIRRYIVSVPTGGVPQGGYPIVFMFHPSAHNGATIYATSMWKEKGEADTILTVFPTALEYCVDDNGVQTNQTKWSCGELEVVACPGQYIKDDFHFVRRMIDTLKSRFLINPRRIYASGFSNGACFAAKLAVQMSDVFAAVGYAGSILVAPDSAQPTRNVPTWFVLGTQDDIWLSYYKQYGITEFPFNDSTLALLSPVIKRVLGCENLLWNYQMTSTVRSLTYTFNTPASPEQTYEFRYTLIKDMGHAYPNGINVPFVAANIFWEFFNQYQMPASVERVVAPTNHLAIYPNPVSTSTTFEFTIPTRQEVTLEIFTIVGAKTATIIDHEFASGTHQVRWDNIDLPRGMYFALLRSGTVTNRRMMTLTR